MSNKTNSADSERRTDLIVGIITIAVILALTAWLFISMSIRGNALSAVTYEGETRRGTEQVFTASVKSPKIKNGDKVKWIVNGEVVAEETYNSDEPLTLNYTPKESGVNYVVLNVGKFSKTAYVDVLPPQLTISAPNITVVYGDNIPEYKYDCCGFVGDDSQDMMDYNGICYTCDNSDNKVTADKLDVGVYKLNMEQDCRFKDYEVNYVGGTLTVLPKKLSVVNNFIKTYDQSNCIDNPYITLVGIKEGDDVSAKCDKLYFDNKNVGSKTVMLANVELVGADSRNYVLQGSAYGRILPKKVEVTGLTVCDKMYDGTTRAQIDKMGTLEGVIEGDSVAIGNIGLSFAEAEAGEQKIVLDEITLIGADKDNYVVSGIDVETAKINDTVWNKIFVKNPIVTANGN